MAWYRAGGGGIPSSLKTGMDSVLNKKFGTSTTYPAEGWPDTVNLMGPLPEKTVSGAIASFSDGADTVPLKKCEITLPASLDGYSSVDVHHTGSNVWDEDYALGFWNASGEWYGNTQGYMSSKTHISVKPSTQYCFINGGNTSFYICYYDENKTFIRRDTLAYPSQRVITTPSNCYFVNFSTYSAYGTTYNNDIALNYPSTFTEYAHYSGDTYNIEIPNPNPNLRPSADIDDGMWTTNGTINPSSGGGFGSALTMAVSEKTSYDIYGLLDDLVVYLDSNKTMLSYERLSNTSLSLQNEKKTTPANCAYIGLSALAFDVSSVSVKESFLVYGGTADVVTGEGVDENDNPFTFDPVPIDSKLGNNTLWSEQGSAEVTYRADINLALGGQ